MRDPERESEAGALRRELERFDPDLPIERARTPPGSWYRGEAMLALEAERVFGRSFHAVGRADQVAEPGAFFTARVSADPIVCLRDAEHRLRAFHNVCRHHGAELCSGEGRARALVCPYHAWTYDLGGSLLRAPGTELARGSLALPELRVARFGPLVLVDPGGRAPDPQRELEPLARHCEPRSLSALRFVARREYELRCNWKVFVENYLDGGYHVAHLHRGLAEQLELGSYRTEVHGRLALQLCAGGPESGVAGGDFRERIGAGAVYAWLYPNLMLNRYGPVLDTNVVVPQGPERCRVLFDYWIDPAAADADPSFVERCLAASEQVQREDEAICESVQRGLASSSYEGGFYAPRYEAALRRFHELLASDLGSAPTAP